MLISPGIDIKKKGMALFFSQQFNHTLSPAGVLIYTVQGPLSLKITGGIEEGLGSVPDQSIDFSRLHGQGRYVTNKCMVQSS